MRTEIMTCSFRMRKLFNRVIPALTSNSEVLSNETVSSCQYPKINYKRYVFFFVGFVQAFQMSCLGRELLSHKKQSSIELLPEIKAHSNVTGNLESLCCGWFDEKNSFLPTGHQLLFLHFGKFRSKIVQLTRDSILE